MAYRAEGGVISRSREAVEVYAGSVLSLLGVLSPQVRERYVGPENDDRRIPDTYPLTPLHWRVAHTHVRELHGIGAGALTEFRGIDPIPDDAHLLWPKYFQNVGITSVPVAELRPADGDWGTPIVFWPYGDHILAAKIPDRHLDEVPEYGDFRWAMRFNEIGRFGAGRLLAGRVVMAAEVEPLGTVLTTQVPTDIPAY